MSYLKLCSCGYQFKNIPVGSKRWDDGQRILMACPECHSSNTVPYKDICKKCYPEYGESLCRVCANEYKDIEMDVCDSRECDCNETRSTVDLRKVDTRVYAKHSSTDVLFGERVDVESEHLLGCVCDKCQGVYGL